MKARSLPSWVLPTALVLVVAALVTIALTRGPVALDPDTPEGTVQEYLIAVSDQRWEDALNVIHADWKQGCEPDDFEAVAVGDFTARLGPPSGLSGAVVTERFVDIAGAPPLTGDTVTVDVTVSHGDDFGGGWDEHVVFELVDEDDFYWIVGDPWPYMMWNCSGR